MFKCFFPQPPCQKSGTLNLVLICWCFFGAPDFQASSSTSRAGPPRGAISSSWLHSGLRSGPKATMASEARGLKNMGKLYKMMRINDHHWQTVEFLRGPIFKEILISMEPTLKPTSSHAISSILYVYVYIYIHIKKRCQVHNPKRLDVSRIDPFFAPFRPACRACHLLCCCCSTPWNHENATVGVYLSHLGLKDWKITTPGTFWNRTIPRFIWWGCEFCCKRQIEEALAAAGQSFNPIPKHLRTADVMSDQFWPPKKQELV